MDTHSRKIWQIHFPLKAHCLYIASRFAAFRTLDFPGRRPNGACRQGLASQRHALVLSTCIIAALFPTISHAGETLEGTVSVIDGDTFEIHGQRIRLAGIDAPESSQNCYTENGSPWRCGQRIANNISKLVGRKTISCNISGNDRYGRHIGTCFYKSKNINKTIVRFGWAMAYRKYSTAYVDVENQARATKTGIWTGPFIAPWDWRKGVRYE